MRLITFCPFRALGIPGARYLKPDLMFTQLDALRGVDFALFPQHWQVDALDHGLGVRTFPSPATYRLGHDKVTVTRALWTVAPGNVPHTIIAARTEEAVASIPDALGYPLVAKIPRGSMGSGVHLVEGPADWRAYVAETPVLYAQERLPIRRDLRLVVIGEQVVCGYWREAPEGGFHNNVARGAEVHHDDVPPAAVALVESIARRLGIDHAGFDVAEVGGHHYVLEFNPLFGTAGIAAAGIQIAPLILDYLHRRLAPSTPPTFPRNPDHPGLPLAG
ncbi:MAG: hypothetical protein H6983_15525 [Ectothiorhodospiraceae bacterium]|nr:hypothetical protein [Ectothiorhodospiraceae bacterium]